jgi:hypothetical protein
MSCFPYLPPNPQFSSWHPQPNAYPVQTPNPVNLTIGVQRGVSKMVEVGRRSPAGCFSGGPPTGCRRVEHRRPGWNSREFMAIPPCILPKSNTYHPLIQFNPSEHHQFSLSHPTNPQFSPNHPTNQVPAPLSLPVPENGLRIHFQPFYSISASIFYSI